MVNSISFSQGTAVNGSSIPTTGSVTGQSFGGDQFMALLLAQLRNQNPLEPMEDRDLMGQITQLNSLQELQKINGLLQQGNSSSQLTEAAGLIGKHITFANENGQLAQGLVTGVSMLNGKAALWVGEYIVPLTGVITVSEASAEGDE